MNESTGYTDSNSFVLNSVHMIDDRMTPLDPVEELCLFDCKETLARCVPPIPIVTGVEETGCSKTSQEVRSYPVSWLCRTGRPGVTADSHHRCSRSTADAVCQLRSI
ncbi:hypothetical protein AMECASPLE_022150 [Ameca splendens]|uniref:Uncharacterized protein n=1 Tax=Ameca splendens TaxID=208324 RepID=A0ABV0YRA5_9TELE